MSDYKYPRENEMLKTLVKNIVKSIFGRRPQVFLTTRPKFFKKY